MTGMIHNAAVSVLHAKYPGSQTKKFRKAVIEAQGDEDWELDTVQWMRPDLYLIEKDKRTITIWEVEDYHKIDDVKMSNLAWLWFHLDCEEWKLRLITTDRYGQETAINLGTYYVAGLGKRPPNPDDPQAFLTH